VIKEKRNVRYFSTVQSNHENFKKNDLLFSKSLT